MDIGNQPGTECRDASTMTSEVSSSSLDQIVASEAAVPIATDEGAEPVANTEQVHFDLFDSGTIWTQVANTQVQQAAWIRRQNGSGADEPQLEAIDVPGGGFNGSPSSAALPPPFTDPLDEEFADDFDAEDCDAMVEWEGRMTQAATQGAEPWWRKGRTAPLLNQLDDDRQAWYRAQAGVYAENDGVHDAVGRDAPEACEAAVDDPDRRQERDPSSSPPIIVYERTPARPPTSASTQAHNPSTISNGVVATPSRASTSMSGLTPSMRSGPAFATPLRPGATPQRAALTLAGNVNTPLGLAAVRPNTAAQTPKRKTWDSTWAQREAAANLEASQGIASASTAKRRRGQSNGIPSRSPGRGGAGRGRGGRGRGGTTAATQTTSTTTTTIRGRPSSTSASTGSRAGFFQPRRGVRGGGGSSTSI